MKKDLGEKLEELIKDTGVTGKSNIFIISDNSYKHIAEPLFNKLKRCVNVDYMNLDYYGRRPMLELPHMIAKTIRESDVTFFALANRESERTDELMLFKEIFQYGSEKGRVYNLRQVLKD